MKKEAEQFINDLKGIRDYWVETGKKAGYDTKRTCDGLVFSILSYLDGCSMSNQIVLFTTTDDGKLGPMINDEDELHENYYK